MAKVTGVGGVFFQSRGDRAALAAWYQKHLGMRLEDFGGAILRWPDDRAEDYRIDDLGEMLSQLRANGVEVIGGPESHENGKFAWIMDPDGNKVELWEPKIWDDKNKEA
jgi:Glyoxalase/Bleomycin resistance protein/Dioxygenase superfamily